MADVALAGGRRRPACAVLTVAAGPTRELLAATGPRPPWDLSDAFGRVGNGSSIVRQAFSLTKKLWRQAGKPDLRRRSIVGPMGPSFLFLICQKIYRRKQR